MMNRISGLKNQWTCAKEYRIRNKDIRSRSRSRKIDTSRTSGHIFLETETVTVTETECPYSGPLVDNVHGVLLVHCPLVHLSPSQFCCNLTLFNIR